LAALVGSGPRRRTRTRACSRAGARASCSTNGEAPLATAATAEAAVNRRARLGLDASTSLVSSELQVELPPPLLEDDNGLCLFGLNFWIHAPNSMHDQPGLKLMKETSNEILDPDPDVYM
jgi:hypothetical protein